MVFINLLIININIINENICQPGSAIQSFIAGDFDDLDYILFVFDYNE